MLLRPARIGTLALLGGMTTIVLVGAEGWWIVLGITLFQAAASTLIVVWVDIPPARLRQPTEHQPAYCFPSDYLASDYDYFASDPLPRQRQPRPDE